MTAWVARSQAAFNASSICSSLYKTIVIYPERDGLAFKNQEARDDYITTSIDLDQIASSNYHPYSFPQ